MDRLQTAYVPNFSVFLGILLILAAIGVCGLVKGVNAEA